LSKAKLGQNLGFDVNIMGAELHRMGIDSPMATAVLDTCTEVTAKLLQLPGGRGGKFKLTLTELHEYLFNKPFQKHNATADVEATTRCF
jgi:DNA polymerase-3 subunit alpha